MKGIEKYDNLSEVIPKLLPVLREAIQSEFLEIKEINRECEKFIETCERFPDLKNARYVIFSQHIKKNEHKNELFAFIDEEGKIIRHITGRDMELYGLLGSCSNLHVSEEFEEQQRYCNGDECRH